MLYMEFCTIILKVRMETINIIDNVNDTITEGESKADTTCLYFYFSLNNEGILKFPVMESVFEQILTQEAGG